MKPEWYAEVKQARLSTMRFDEEMKRKVLQQMEQKTDSKRSHVRWIWGLTVICSLWIVVGTVGKLIGSQQGLFWQQGKEAGIHLPYVSLDEASDLQIIGSRTLAPLQQVALSSVEVKEVYTFERIGKYMIYTYPDEESSPLYDGLILEELGSLRNGELLQYGVGGLSEVELVRSEALGEFDYVLSGTCGPHIFCSRWLRLDGGEVIGELQLNSPAYEHDLDGDGIKEIVLVGTSYFRDRVYVLKKRNSQIELADLNAVLQIGHPDKLVYDEKNQLFQVWMDGKLKQLYRYSSTGDQLLPVAKSKNKKE